MSVVELFNRRWLGPPPLQQQTPLWLAHPDNIKKKRRRYSESWYYIRYSFFLAADFQIQKLYDLHFKKTPPNIIKFYNDYAIEYSVGSVDKKIPPNRGLSKNLFKGEPELYLMSQIWNETDFYFKALPELMFLSKKFNCQLINPSTFASTYFDQLSTYYDKLNFKGKFENFFLKFSKKIDKYTPASIADLFGPVFDILFYPWPNYVHYSLATIGTLFFFMRLEPYQFARYPKHETKMYEKWRNQVETMQEVKQFLTRRHKTESFFWSLPNLKGIDHYYKTYFKNTFDWINSKLGTNFGERFKKVEREPELHHPWLQPIEKDYSESKIKKPDWAVHKQRKGVEFPDSKTTEFPDSKGKEFSTFFRGREFSTFKGYLSASYLNPNQIAYNHIMSSLKNQKRSFKLNENLNRIENFNTNTVLSSRNFNLSSLNIKNTQTFKHQKYHINTKFNINSKFNINQNLNLKSIYQSRPFHQLTFQKSFHSSKTLRDKAETTTEKIDLSNIKLNFLECEPYKVSDRELLNLIKSIGGKIPKDGLKMPPKKMWNPTVIQSMVKDEQKVQDTLESVVRVQLSTPELTKMATEMDSSLACKVLGLTEEEAISITLPELEDRFNSLSTRVHPDLGSGTKLLAQKVNEAFDTLKKIKAGASNVDVKHGSRFSEKKMTSEKTKKTKPLTEEQKNLRKISSSQQNFVQNRLHQIADSGNIIDSWGYVSVDKRGKVVHPRFRPFKGFRAKLLRDYIVDPIFGRWYPTAEQRALEAESGKEVPKWKSSARYWYSKFCKVPPPF